MNRRAGRVHFDDAVDITVSHLILGPSEKRRRIIFTAGTSPYTLSNDSPVIAESGIRLGITGSGILYLDYDVDGDIVCKPWFGIADNQFQRLGYIEIIDLD